MTEKHRFTSIAAERFYYSNIFPRTATEEPENVDALIVQTVESLSARRLCHEDAGIRLWSTEGKLLHEAVAMTRSTGVAVTAYCTDTNCNVLVTGKQSLQYITRLVLGVARPHVRIVKMHYLLRRLFDSKNFELIFSLTCFLLQVMCWVI